MFPLRRLEESYIAFAFILICDKTIPYFAFDKATLVYYCSVMVLMLLFPVLSSFLYLVLCKYCDVSAFCQCMFTCYCLLLSSLLIKSVLYLLSHLHCNISVAYM